MATPTIDKFSYSVKEFSDRTGISVDILRRHIKAGTLVAAYPSEKAYITHTEGQRWLDSLPAEQPGS